MSELSQYQNVFRVGKHDTTRNGTQARATKRNREPVSCLTCRMRKSVSGEVNVLLVAHCLCRLKCDRQVPCTSCSMRGNAASCNYSNGAPHGRGTGSGGSRATEAQLRLQKLEEIVTSLMQTSKDGYQSSSKPATYNSTVDRRLKDLSIHSSPQTFETCSGGRLDINGTETNYLGATHWTTILENVGVPEDRMISL